MVCEIMSFARALHTGNLLKCEHYRQEICDDNNIGGQAKFSILENASNQNKTACWRRVDFAFIYPNE